MRPNQLRNLISKLRRYDYNLSEYEDGPEEEDFEQYADFIEENFDIYTSRHYEDYDDIFTDVSESLSDSDGQWMFDDDEAYNNYND